MKVFVHIDAYGTYIGNGGFLLLTDLANRLANMGYDVNVFDAQNRLKGTHFAWLSMKEVKFGIVKARQVKNEDAPFRVVSAWLKALPISLRKNLRYLESSELIRQGKQKERQYLIDNKVKIANLHPYLAPFYEKLGIHDMINFPIWVDDRAKEDSWKTPNSIGIQLEQKHSFFKLWKRYDTSPYLPLYQQFEDTIILCNGSYTNVLRKMKQADFYVHFPEPSPHIQLFKGETLGRPLFEAMACDCVSIARKHEGIGFLQGIIPLVSSMNEAVSILKGLMVDEENKDAIRTRSLKLIKENYRFDSSREQAIRKWLE